MEWLNYHHLYYFWHVSREGSIQAASRKLRVSPSTISTQLKQLEESLDCALFERSGRRLVPSEEGNIALRYADEIFSLGSEMMDTLAGRETGKPVRLRVGAAMVMPKLVVYRLLASAFDLDQPVHLICTERSPERLLADLALHQLDLVFMDSPISPGSNVKAFNHPLGGCPVSIFGHPDLIEAHGAELPGSLHKAPFLLPTSHAALRRTLERWFDKHRIRPIIVGEFQDSALMKVFGEAGHGFFAAPSLVSGEVVKQYGVVDVGQLDEGSERYYAITVDRRISNPAVAEIARQARGVLQS